jgi:hypothetical protein
MEARSPASNQECSDNDNTRAICGKVGCMHWHQRGMIKDVNDLVRAAINLVRADAEASGVPAPPYIDSDWEWYQDRAVAGPDLIVTVADRLQEAIIEELWPSRDTNWPACPAHPRTHPMKATVVNGTAVWACVDGTAYASIGSLFTSEHQARRTRSRRKGQRSTR